MADSILIEVGATGADQVVSEFDLIDRSAQKAQNTLEDFGSMSGMNSFIGDIRSARNEFDDLRGAIDGVSGMGAKLAAGGGAALAGMAAGIKTAIDAFGEIESVEAGFETMLGSPEAAKAKIKEVQDFARNSPFDFTESAKSTQKLLAMGFAAEEIIPTLKSVGNAVAAGGGDTEAFSGILTALGQIRTKGKVSQEELNQITERGVSVQFLADKLGLTAEQMGEIGSQGIDAERAIKAITEGFAELGGGTGMEKQMETIPGQLSSLGDSAKVAAAAFGEVFAADASNLIGNLTTLLDKTTAFVKNNPELAKTIATLAGGTAVAAVGIGGTAAIGGSVARGAMDIAALYNTVKGRGKNKDDDEAPKKKKRAAAVEEEDESESGDGGGALKDVATGKIGALAGDAAAGLAKNVLGEEVGGLISEKVGELASEKTGEMAEALLEKAKKKLPGKLGKAAGVLGSLVGMGGSDGEEGGDSEGLDGVAKAADGATKAKKKLVDATNDDIKAERNKTGVAKDEASALDDVAEAALGATAEKEELAAATNAASNQMSIFGRIKAGVGTNVQLGQLGTRTVGQLGGAAATGAFAGWGISDSLKNNAGMDDNTANAIGLGSGLAVGALTIAATSAILPVAAATAIAKAIEFGVNKFYNEPAEKAAEDGTGADNEELNGKGTASDLAGAMQKKDRAKIADIYTDMAAKARENGDDVTAESYMLSALSQRKQMRKEQERQVSNAQNSYGIGQYNNAQGNAYSTRTSTQGDVSVEVKVVRKDTKFEKDSKEFAQNRRKS